MTQVSTAKFKAGLKVIFNDEPHSIVSNEFVKPGKGQAFNRVKLKNLLNHRVIDKTFKSGETLDTADIMDIDLQYLYNDGIDWHFIHPDTFNQYTASALVVGDAGQWLKSEDICKVMLYNNEPIQVLPPNFVELTVQETEPGVRGDTATGGSKSATLETGATVKVPLFVEEGEVIRVDTRTAEYMGRTK